MAWSREGESTIETTVANRVDQSPVTALSSHHLHLRLCHAFNLTKFLCLLDVRVDARVRHSTVEPGVVLSQRYQSSSHRDTVLVCHRQMWNSGHRLESGEDDTTDMKR
eukprot:GFYU01000587.1.p1 GENE.GFYU01000587.1~~GFYU01000587.1.p1  ORF type:complete len:108 (-),score=11.61 GFYU01000587.1:102-425(-)